MISDRDGDTRLAKEIAYDHIKDIILRLDPREGQFIKEEEVAEATGISRTPVREALLKLEAERLLRLVPKKGAFVPPVSEQEIVDLMELRLLIEEFTAVHAMGKPTLVDQLEDILQQQKDAANTADDPDSFINSDLRFHIVLTAAAGNRVIADIYESLRNRQLRLGRNVIAVSTPRRFQGAIEEHSKIIGALKSGEGDTVRQAIRGHLDSTLAAALGRPGTSGGLFRTVEHKRDLP